MRSDAPRGSFAGYGTALRQELCRRNAAYAAQQKLAHATGYQDVPIVVYEGFPEKGRHGNFLTASYKAILERPAWRQRLTKVHSNARRCLPRTEKRWMELDSCTSSDALLMNVFCHPSTRRSSTIRSMFGCPATAMPEFGVKPRVPLKSGRLDRTEIDMVWGDLLFESKLTEADFQWKGTAEVERYRDLELVFDVDELPKREGNYLSYQLIRNILAAHALDRELCVLVDVRRPDLQQACYEMFRAVRLVPLRTRCKLLTWQELAASLSATLRRFLDLKYGIVAPGEIGSAIASLAKQ